MPKKKKYQMGGVAAGVAMVSAAKKPKNPINAETPKTVPLDDQKEFLSSYFNSPKFAERAKNFGNTDLNNPETFSNNVKNLSYYKLPVGYAKSDTLGSRAWMDDFSKAFPELKIPSGTDILLDPDQGKSMGLNDQQLMSEVYPHEMNHLSGRNLSFNEEMEFASRNVLNGSRAIKLMSSPEYAHFLLKEDKINAPNSFSNFLKLKPSGNEHDLAPDENYSDLNAFRYLLNKEKIYDTRTQDFNKDFLKKAKDNPTFKKSFIFKRLQKTFTDDGLIELMNKIASNPVQQTDTPMAKSGIHIKPSHKGLLHKNLGIPQGQPIPASKLEIKSTDSPAVRKRKTFAKNARSWNKGQDGLTLDNTQMLPINMQSTSPYNWMQTTTNNGAAPQTIQAGNQQGKQFDLSGALATGLAAIDAIIPTKKRNSTVIRPALSYNEHPYGTGSQAIAEQGITISRTGYKANSKDKNKKHLRIPSNNITMKNVPHPVVGTDNLGNTQVMVPGNEYQFPGDYVDETPLTAFQGITVPANYKPIKAQDGANVPRLTPEQIAQFNGFNKYVKDKGLTQSDKLNNQQFSKSLYDEYRKANPSVQLTYEEMIPRAQQEQSLLKNFASGVASRRGDPGADSIMNKITPFDGMYGPKTSYYDLPQMSVVDKQNGQVVNQQNLGIITGTGQPTGIGGSGKPLNKKVPPPGVTLEPLYDASGNKTGMGYTDPQTGDVVRMKSGGWISGAINPAHKGYCTPMTKSTCTPRRKALAKRFKSGDLHRSENGSIIPLGNEEMMELNTAHDGLTIGKAKEMLKDGTAHGHKLSKKQKKYFGYIAGGGTPKAEEGLTILDENTVQFNGPSHADGGIPISYAGKKVEVEGAETGYISPEDGSLSIMGNMINPLTGRKFKSDSKLLSKKKEKATDLTAYASKLLEKANPTDKWQNLTFNSAKVMLNGGYQKAKEIEQSQEHLKTIQEVMLEHSNEMGYDPQEFSKGKAKMGKLMTIFPTILEDGGTVKYQDGGKIKYNQTRTQGLDDKIKEFASLLEKKGFSGTAGPESGQSNRNTLSGRKSRHASGQALDLVLNNPEAYQAVLKDPDLSKYLIDNGLTVLNEYDPNVQKKTGATTGHLHIGYDQGTPLSNQFRTDAANMYKSSNPSWKWGNSRPIDSTPLKGVPSGDQQYFPYTIPPVDYTPITPTPNQQTPQSPLPNYIPGSDFQNPTNPVLPSDAQPLELGQVLPEIYTAATNRQEPVFAQQYNPELYQPYQVSFQDRLNENQGTFNSLQKAAAYNPSALATLASQQYSADSGVLADEFRTNQGIYNDVTNKNIALLNDAQGKNLQIADTQYVRQSQAKSNTKAINHDVLNSISNKLLQREADNKALQVYENLYDYRYNEKKNMNLEYLGAPGAEYVDWQGTPVQPINSNQSSRTTYSPSGSVKSTSVSNPSPLSTQLKQERLSTMKQDSILKLLNSTKKNGKYSYLPPELWMGK